MKISEEHKEKAREIKIILSRLEPEVLYHLALFMDFDPCDEGMFSQCVYEAIEKADVYSSDGKPQDFILRMGLALPDIKVRINFQDIGDGMYETGEAEIVKCTSSEQ